MFKNSLVIFSVCLVLLCFGGCGGADNTVSDLSSDIDNVSVDDNIEDDIRELINNYFSAFKSHSHQMLTEYTTSECNFNYDQTAFEEFSRYISDFTVDEIDFKNMEGGDKLELSVKYTLFFSEEYLEQGSGKEREHKYYDDFIVEKNQDGKYVISSAQHKGEG